MNTATHTGPPVPAHLALLSLVTGGGWDLVVAGSSAPAPRDPVVYGPGRGLWLDAATARAEMAAGRLAAVELGASPGCWVISRGPGALGLSARQRNGAEVPSLHCSSFTALLLGVATGADANWTHTSTMATLEDTCERVGQFTVPIQPSGRVRCWGYGDHCRRIVPRVGRAMGPLEVWQRRAELGPLTVLLQSTRSSGSWRWGHHTLALVRLPGHPGVLYRVAADGSASGGVYSGTRMDTEILDEAEARRLEGQRLYEAWTIDNPQPSRCPITLEI